MPWRFITCRPADDADDREEQRELVGDQPRCCATPSSAICWRRPTGHEHADD
jgi:hypothetical protein